MNVNVRQSRPSDYHCHQIPNIHHFIHSHFGIEKKKKKEAESLLTPHHRLQLVRWVWALPGWPARAPDPRRPAGFCSPEPACGQLPTSAADSPPSARSRCSAGPAASYWSDRLNLCSAASWCLRSGAGKITWHRRVQISKFSQYTVAKHKVMQIVLRCFFKNAFQIYCITLMQNKWMQMSASHTASAL